jgi:hypothetical protein
VLVAVERQHLRRQHLQLQRHGEPVLRPARPEAEEHLAGNEHLARGAALQAVEVGEPLGVGLVGPVEPERCTCALSAASAIIDDGLMPAPTTLPAQLSIALAA